MVIATRGFLVGLCLLAAVTVRAQDVGFANAWPELTQADASQVQRFAEDLKGFIGQAKSETAFVRSATAFAESSGFRLWRPATPAAALVPGSRWYGVNRDRTIVLFVIGTEPLENGLRIVSTHTDSPHLAFKTQPFRDSQQAVLIDTQVHGGLKNYQWVNVPLAITGRVDKADGTTVWIDMGNAPGDPVLLITDLAPHVDRDFRSRTQPQVIGTEELDPLAGTMPPIAADGQRTPTDRVLALLHERYAITARDLLSADLQIVPATMPRDVGLDRALVGAYGQDDRATAYVSLRAIAEVKTPRYTSVAYAVNNEETASWNTGVNSEWFSTLISEVLAAQKGGDFNALSLRCAYARTEVLVSDCTTAVNPLFPQPQNPRLTSRLGYGMVVKEYGPGREANPEFFARMRGLFDREQVRWQTHAYDAGYGGGTIAGWFAGQNMDVMDVGVGLVSMHSPFEVSSKVDLWHLRRGFEAFFNNQQ
jgi:aspartyl aminopeptidase